MFELVETAAPNAVIKVIGVGGGGGNAVNHMLGANIEGVEFVVREHRRAGDQALPGEDRAAARRTT